MDFSQSITGIEPDGSFLARTRFQAVRFWRESATVHERFDSARPPHKPSPEVAIYAALAGSQVTMHFDARGRLLEVRDLNAFINRILQARGVRPAEQAQVRTAMARSQQSSETFRSIGNAIGSFPEPAVALLSSWPKLDPLGTNARLLLDGSCTLSKIEGNRATISLQSAVIPNTADPDAPTNATGTRQGEYEVELSSGWTRSAHLKQEVTLKSEAISLTVTSELSLKMLGYKPPGEELVAQ